MNRALFVAISIANLGGLLFGFGIAVTTGAMPFLTSEFQLNAGVQGLAVNSALIGSVLGALIIGRPGDFFGRRRMMMVVALLFLFSAIASGVIGSFKFFLISRFIAGVAIGGVAVLSPVYISELSPPKIRGRLTASFQLAIVIGMLVALISDYMLMDTGINNWRYMFMVGALPALLFFLLLFFVPESPRYLMQRRKEHEANIVLHRTNPELDIDGFAKDFIKSVNIRIISSNAYLFRQSYFRVFVIAVAVGMFNQFTGINAVLYYTTDLFRSFGFVSNYGIEQGVIIGLTNLIFILVAMTKIDKAGRKKLLLIGSVGMAVCLSLFAVLFSAGLQESYIMLPVLIGFTGFFAASQGTVIWVLMSEMFSNNIRIRGASIGLFSYWSFYMVTSFLFPFIATNQGVGNLFAFYAVATFGSFFFFRKYLVEMKGKTLEEIKNDGMRKESPLS